MAKVLSPFVGREDKFSFPLQPEATYYTDWEIVLKTVITGYENDDPEKPIGSMVPTIVEHKTDIQSLIDKDADQVGVVNIIRRIAQTGDLSLLQQGNPIDGDLTELPQSIAEVQAKALSAELLYAQLPEDMKKGLTMEQFVSRMDDDSIRGYFQSLVDKAKQSESVKEGE